MTQKDASVIGPRIDHLATAHGHVTPKHLVEDARPKGSAIHRYIFDCDDREAAEKYRIERAEYLLRSVITIIDVPDSRGRSEATPVRSFFNVEIAPGDADNKPERGYVTIEQVRSNADYLGQIIEDAKQQLIGWQERHRIYMSLRPFARQFSRVNGEILRLRKKPR